MKTFCSKYWEVKENGIYVQLMDMRFDAKKKGLYLSAEISSALVF